MQPWDTRLILANDAYGCRAYVALTTQMHRYFFHVEGQPDDLGMELPTIAAAKCEAVRYAGTLICEEAERFWDAAEFNMTVADENGLTLFTLTLIGTEAPTMINR